MNIQMGSNNFFVTGPARSGTTMLSVCLNHFPDVVCLSETFYDPVHCEEYMDEIRGRILRGEPVPNRYDSAGELSMKSLVDAEVSERKVKKPLSPNFKLGHKGGHFWLMNMEPVIVSRLRPFIVIVRDPAPTIASWSKPVAIEKMPVSQMTEVPPLSGGFMRYNGMVVGGGWPPEAQTPIERRAALWNASALTIARLARELMIVRYEDFVDRPAIECRRLADELQTQQPRDLPEIKKYDWRERYGSAVIDECEAAVRKFAPVRKAFGY